MDEFSKDLFIEGIPQYERVIQGWVDSLTANGAGVLGTKLWRAWLQFVIDMERFAEGFARTATKALKEKEQQTRVRPDTGGQGGPRIRDYLEADPIRELPGSVGLANETKLDANVYGVWLPNEIGSSGRVGAQLHGYFMDGQGGGEAFGFGGYAPGFAADPSMSREHPLFQPMSGPPMSIHNPIPAREYILKTIQDVEPQWHAGVRRLRVALDAKIAAIKAEYEAWRVEQIASRGRTFLS